MRFGTILHRLSQTEDASNYPEAAETLLKLGAELEKHGQIEQAQEMFSRGAAILDKLARAS
jgi:TolA-binding protein